MSTQISQFYKTSADKLTRVTSLKSEKWYFPLERHETKVQIENFISKTHPSNMENSSSFLILRETYLKVQNSCWYNVTAEGKLRQ